jgi:hypothetical protein
MSGRFAEHREELRAMLVGQDVAHQAVHAMPVTADRQAVRSVERAAPVLHVLRNVDDHRSRTAGARDLERGSQRGFELGRIGDQEHVLGDRAHDAGNRRFLECIAADRGSRHLTADHHDRHRVRHAIAHRRDGVGRARPGRDDAHADLAGRTRIARSHEARALLVGRHDQRHRSVTGRSSALVVYEDGVVGRQDRAAAVTKNGFDTLVGEHLHDDLGARHDLAGERVGGVRRARGEILFHVLNPKNWPKKAPKDFEKSLAASLWDVYEARGVPVCSRPGEEHPE